MPLLVTRGRFIRYLGFTPWYIRPLFQYTFETYSKLYVDPELPLNTSLVSAEIAASASNSVEFLTVDEMQRKVDVQLLKYATLLTVIGSIWMRSSTHRNMRI